MVQGYVNIPERLVIALMGADTPATITIPGIFEELSNIAKTNKVVVGGFNVSNDGISLIGNSVGTISYTGSGDSGMVTLSWAEFNVSCMSDNPNDIRVTRVGE